MGGKIDYYYDTVSPYSWFALHYLSKNKEALRSHGVQIELHPVFLGGIMQKSGNKPPWTLPAKQAHGKLDKERAQRYFGLDFGTPSFFPILSLLPQRCFTYIKDTHSPQKLEDVSVEGWKMLWVEQKDISKPEIMTECLSRHFTAKEVEEIMKMANSAPIKSKLLANTDKLVDSGAYGCPWFEVTNSQGHMEPFFGSDRFHYMWTFLDLPWKDIEIVPKNKL